jgi:hypothetical protein
VSFDSTFVETRRLQIAVVYDSDAKKSAMRLSIRTTAHGSARACDIAHLVIR